VETANNNQRLDIEHIQAYVMDELQRQNAAANHTKQICEQKLVELQYQLEDVKHSHLCSNQADLLIFFGQLNFWQLCARVCVVVLFVVLIMFAAFAGDH